MKALKQFITLIIGLFFVFIPQVLMIGVSKGADIENGKNIYGKKCVFCHGQGGKGDGPVAASLPTKPGSFADKEKMSQWSDAKLKEMILDGKTPMPSFKGKLSDTDIDDIIAYIRTFAGEEINE
jgi:mono/diheme cytochrome c family protein